MSEVTFITLKDSRIEALAREFAYLAIQKLKVDNALFFDMDTDEGDENYDEARNEFERELRYALAGVEIGVIECP